MSATKPQQFQIRTSSSLNIYANSLFMASTSPVGKAEMQTLQQIPTRAFYYCSVLNFPSWPLAFITNLPMVLKLLSQTTLSIWTALENICSTANNLAHLFIISCAISLFPYLVSSTRRFFLFPLSYYQFSPSHWYIISKVLFRLDCLLQSSLELFNTSWAFCFSLNDL